MRRGLFIQKHLYSSVEERLIPDSRALIRLSVIISAGALPSAGG